jgi:hypothetical protein
MPTLDVFTVMLLALLANNALKMLIAQLWLYNWELASPFLAILQRTLALRKQSQVQTATILHKAVLHA